MRVLITGASGLVGTRLAESLLADRHAVIATSRDPAERRWPSGIRPQKWAGKGPLDLAGIDAIVNLAGASIGGRRWSPPYKRTMRRSRIEVTRGLADAIGALPEADRPVLVSASAVGYYGRWPDGPCPEDRHAGDDYLAHLARDWESAADCPTRVVRFRFGHVLDGRGGLLERILPIYKARIGGPLGSGKQPMPWVHHADLVRAVRWAIEGDAAGAYNLVAPDIRPYKEFHGAIERATAKQAGLPVPGAALRVAVGGLAPYLTGGQHADPVRLQDEGFSFEQPDLDAALADTIAW